MLSESVLRDGTPPRYLHTEISEQTDTIPIYKIEQFNSIFSTKSQRLQLYIKQMQSWRYKTNYYHAMY